MSISEYYPLASRLDNIPIKKIISFKKGAYWIITFNYGLIYLNTDNGTLETFFNDEEDRANVTSIVDHEGKIYVSLLYRMFQMQPDGKNFRVISFHKDYPFPQIRELFSYDHALWIGTMAEGCYLITDPVENRESIVASKDFPGGIAGFTVDKNGNLWIGMRGSGIYR